MKKILFIAMAFASMFFASCMGDGYADPDNTIKVPAAPVGDNNIKEKNVKIFFLGIIKQKIFG